MATQEIFPSQIVDYIGEANTALNIGVDPLEIAARALAKLKEHGLSGYIEPGIADVESAVEEVIAQPTEIPQEVVTQNPTPVKVTSLNDYRRAKNIRHRQLDIAEQSKLLDRAKQGDAVALEAIWLDAQGMANYVAGISRSNWPKEDKVQVCLEVIPGVVQRYDTSKGASFNYCLYRRMVGALRDTERAHGRENGLTRSDYTKLQDAIKSTDPQQALHELTKPKQSSSGKIHPGLSMASHLISDSRVVASQISLEGIQHGHDDHEGHVELVDSTHDVFEEVVRNMDAAKLRSILKCLPEKERIVLTYYYGLFDTHPINLREIGEMMGVTEGRVSQVHNKAINCLEELWATDEVVEFNPPNRLKKFKTQPRTINNIEFMQRINSGLDKLRGATLSEEEIETIRSHIPEWQVGRVAVGDNEYWLMQRAVPGSRRGEIKIYNDEPERRKVGRRGEAISMLVQDVRGSDLQLAIQLEQEIKRPKQLYNSEFAAQFCRGELEIISSMFETNAQAGHRLGIEKSTVGSQIHKAMKRLGASSAAELAVIIAREGLIPLDTIPAGQTNTLSRQQSRVLKDCYAMTYDEAAKTLGIAPTTIKVHWHAVFTKTGAVNRTQAALMAMKDGLIPVVDDQATTKRFDKNRFKVYLNNDGLSERSS